MLVQCLSAVCHSWRCLPFCARHDWNRHKTLNSSYFIFEIVWVIVFVVCSCQNYRELNTLQLNKTQSNLENCIINLMMIIKVHYSENSVSSLSNTFPVFLHLWHINKDQSRLRLKQKNTSCIVCKWILGVIASDYLVFKYHSGFESRCQHLETLGFQVDTIHLKMIDDMFLRVMYVCFKLVACHSFCQCILGSVRNTM